LKRLILCCLFSILFCLPAARAQQPLEPILQNVVAASQQAAEAAKLAAQAGAEQAAQQASRSAENAAQKAEQLRTLKYTSSQQPSNTTMQMYLQEAERQALQATQDSQQATQAALRAAREASEAAERAAREASHRAAQAAQEAQAAEESARRATALRNIDMVADALDSFYARFRKLPADDASMKRFVQFAYKQVFNLVANPGEVPTTTSRGHAIFRDLEVGYDNRVGSIPKNAGGDYVLPTDNNWSWEPQSKTRVITDGMNHACFLSPWTQPRFLTMNGYAGDKYDFGTDWR
jgi:hypothetical protein